MKSGRCCLFLLNLNLQILFFLHQFSPIFFELHVFRFCLLNPLVPIGNCALQFFNFLFCISEKKECNVFLTFRISSYSFRGNYSFLNLETQRSQYIKVRKLFKGGNYLFKGGNYMRKYGSLYSKKATSQLI